MRPSAHRAPSALPVRRLHRLRHLLAAALCTATLLHAAAAAAQPFAQTAVTGFTDVNGNGLLDCGEPVQIVATFSTADSGTPALAGTFDLPAAGTTGLDFEPGTLAIDNDLTTGCQATIARGDASGDTSGQVAFTCPADPIDNNSWTLVVRYTALFVGTTPTYTATAQAVLTTGATYDATTTHTAGTACTTAPAALTLAKTAAGLATPGSTLLYTLTLHDTSGLGQGGLQLVDTVPAHTTFDPAASAPGWICTPGPAAGATCRNPVGNLLPNGTLTSYFAVTLDAAFAANATLVNTACVRLGPTTVAACASATTPVAGTPVLHLAKTLAAGTGAPGATLTYTLAATNTGNLGLPDAQLQETLPANTTFQPAASPGWTCTPGPAAGAACTLDLGPLAAGATATRTFAVKVDDPLPPLPPGAAIANTACLTAPPAAAPESTRGNPRTPTRRTARTHPAATAHTPNPSAAPNPGPRQSLTPSCATVSTPTAGAPSLTTVKTLLPGSSAAPGGTLSYDVAAANAGNAGAANVTLTETVPAHTTFKPAASSPAWTCTPGPAAGAACTLPLGTVPADAAAHVTFAVTLDNPLPAGVTQIANTACTQLPGATPTCDTLTTPTLGQPHLTLAKTYTGPPLAPGALLPFHLTAANTGNQDAATVTLTETVPNATSFAAAASTPGWTCTPNTAAGATCTLLLGPLPAGATTSATFALQAATPLPAGTTQIANAACLTATGGATACSQATTPAAATLAAELQATFAHDANHDHLAETGDDLLYTLTVTNPGTTPAHQLALATPLDPHLTLDTGSVTTSAGTVTAGNTAGDTLPTVTLPALAPGATLTITFTASVGPIPDGLKILSTQSTLTADDATPTVSDDPDTPAPLDPTTTPVGTSAIAPASVPTLSTWGLLAMASALGLIPLGRLRRRPGSSPPCPPDPPAPM